MDVDRRRLLAYSAVAGALPAGKAVAAPAPELSGPGVSATMLGVRPGLADDQTRALQHAIDQAAGARAPLVFAPGTYRTGTLNLPTGSHLIGARGSTRFVLTQGPALVSANGANTVTLTGLVLDGASKPLPERSGVVHFMIGRGIKVTDCEIVAAGGNGIMLEQIDGEITSTTVTGAAHAGIFSLDARGLVVSGNLVRGAGNNGILVWRSDPGDDGTMILDNRVEDIAARAGGSGQNGNAINVFRAGNVIVRGNRIRGAAFSAVRGNAASNLQIIGNNCTGLGEVALYAEFDFEGALIADNIVDGAAIGVSVTNFNRGGRLALVHGNLIRNLLPTRPAGTDPDDAAGVGISVEADTVVTGNVIEGAPTAGIELGFGQYLRDVTVTGNIVRQAGVGIAVSVATGAGAALISNNLISGARRGAIVGTDRRSVVTGDLARDGAEKFAQLAISGNQVR